MAGSLDDEARKISPNTSGHAEPHLPKNVTCHVSRSISLEDNIYVARRQLATNRQLVEKAVRLACELERKIATPDEAREMLGLKGREKVRY